MAKNYINPALRNVSLSRARFVTDTAYKAKQAMCSNSALSGQKCWGELETPTVIRDIFANMTEAEFQEWIERLYPKPEKSYSTT